MPRGRGGGGGGMRGGGFRMGGGGGLRGGRRGVSWGGRHRIMHNFRRGRYRHGGGAAYHRHRYPSYYRYYGYPYYYSRFYYTHPYSVYAYPYSTTTTTYPRYYVDGARTAAITYNAGDGGNGAAVNEVRVSTDPSVNASEWAERPNAAVHQGPGGAPPTLLYCTTGTPGRVPSQAVSTRYRPVLALDDAYYQCSV